jgi:predicted AlkP superfamily pyrophosphatase or phosphodiesterase
MRPVLVLNVVGLTRRQIGAETPHLAALARRGACAPMSAVLPAVTCSAQATMLTGTLPSEHGAVGNGWRDPRTYEVALWRQSNHLVRGEKLYEAAARRDPSFTCAKLFWWWNMGAAVTWSLTPRPYYPADGRKVLATYSAPRGFGAAIEAELGPFPFFQFWGPKSGLASSRWIADAALRTMRVERPTLTLVYLPHLDYDHQRFGPRDARSVQALRDVDVLVGELVAAADAVGAATVVVSEYGITETPRPVHINRALREAGLLAVRAAPPSEPAIGDALDVFASRAYAVVDHQLAHVYTRDAASRAEARRVLESLPGVAEVLEGPTRAAAGLDHENAGDLVVLSEHDAWFTYYYWPDSSSVPDFAPTVDIHRKPGYDPCELFVDPRLRLPAVRVARRLAQKKLGFRYLMDVIPLDATLVKGSHGLLPAHPDDGPVWLTSEPWSAANPEPEARNATVALTSVKDRVLGLLSR